MQDIRAWLVRAPQPTSIRTDSGEVIALSGRHRWAEAIASIEALDPNTIEALDAKGAVLRALKLSGDEAPGKQRNLEDPTVALARIMSEVADKAALRHEEAYKTAFNAILGLAQTMEKRMSSVERAYMSLVYRHAETIEIAAENAASGGIDQMAQQFLLARFAAGAAPEEKPKAKPKPEAKANGASD